MKGAEVDQIAHVRVPQQTPRYVSLVADGLLVEGLNDEMVVLHKLANGLKELVFGVDEEDVFVALVGVAKVEEELGEGLEMMGDVIEEVVDGTDLFVGGVDFKLAIVGGLNPFILKPGSQKHKI